MGFLHLHTLQTDSVAGTNRWSLHRGLSSEFKPGFIDSVRQFGIIRPPIVQQTSDGLYEVVCGIHRFRAVTEVLQEDTIGCLVLDPAVGTSAILRIIAEDQKLSGPLSPIEKARYSLLCRQLLSGDEAGKFERDAGLGSSGHLDRLIQLFDLEQPILDAIQATRISEQSGRDFLTLSTADRLLLCDLFIRFSLNHNKQRRLIDMCRTIVAREGGSFEDLLSTCYSEYMTPDSTANIPQATNRLLQDLGERSAPGISAAGKEFSEAVAGLDLPAPCRLSPSRSFEQDTVTLHVEYKNFAEFIKKWNEIRYYFN